MDTTLTRINSSVDNTRLDHRVIASMVTEGSTVLDLGCGNGELLDMLSKVKDVTGSGIEISDSSVFECVEKGLSVFHGNIDSGIAEYHDSAFDYVILNQTLQQVNHLDNAFQDALRVGRSVIVGLPNFAHYNSRCQLFFGGRAPVTPSLPYEWYSTPNLHFCSISDFLSYCSARRIVVHKTAYLGERVKVTFWPNLLARVGIFLVSRAGPDTDVFPEKSKREDKAK